VKKSSQCHNYPNLGPSPSPSSSLEISAARTLVKILCYQSYTLHDHGSCILVGGIQSYPPWYVVWLHVPYAVVVSTRLIGTVAIDVVCGAVTTIGFFTTYGTVTLHVHQVKHILNGKDDPAFTSSTFTSTIYQQPGSIPSWAIFEAFFLRASGQERR